MDPLNIYFEEEFRTSSVDEISTSKMTFRGKKRKRVS